MENIKIIEIITCIATIMGVWISYLAYRNAKEVNMKIDNRKSIKVDGNKNVIQSHEGVGDNVGRNKNE